MNPAIWQIVAAVYGFAAVSLGAFAAHGLKSRLDAYALDIMATATQYALIHAALLFGISLLPTGRWTSIAGFSMGCGVLLFSGSLYALALSGVRALGAITPLGGLLLLIGWFSLFVSGLSRVQAGA